MRAFHVLCASAALLVQVQAIWPFDSDSSSTNSDSTETSAPSDGGESWIQSVVGNFGGSESASSNTDAAASTDDSNPYAPYNSTCPSESLTRDANDISDLEKEYIQKRQEITNKNLINFLQNKSNLTDFDAESFINDNAKDHNITIGLSFSGGGYRAMLCGAGQLLATDDRYEGANDHGVGGLLQSATYITGLSGGNWLVGSLVMNNWLSVAEIVNGSSTIWQLEDSILNPSGIRIDKTIAYYYGLREAVTAKDDAGFDTTITDIWGRALSYQFFPDESGGENITWSSVRNMSHFKDHTMPYFLVVSNARRPGDLIINENSTVIEISAHELGSWDPSLNAFTDVEYLGSSVDSGNPNDTNVCVRNFDNAGFIMGTSSSLFNQVLLQLGDYDINSVIKSILTGLLSRISYAEWDIASYEPNPFFGQQSGESVAMVRNETLFLVDGGEDLQNVPFYPLIQNTRDVDVIFAFDNSADTNESWPNATSIISTYKRQFAEQGKGTPFPFVPDVDKFLDEDLSSKPVFFGCNASDLDALIKWHNNSDINATDVPLVVYVSNHHQSYYSNFSTFKLSYEDAEKYGTIRNGFEVMSRNNLTDDSNWLTCVGCAIIRRQQERFGQEQSDECKKCFQEYCWSGGVKDAAPVSSASGLSDITGLRTSSVVSTATTSGSTSGQTSAASSGSETTSSESPSSSEKKNDGAINGGQPSFFFLLGNLLLAVLAN
ncbi:Plb5 GPI-linked phospholipase B [Candida orthopsilosis Co 90-125]|uniref:Lysophospholipase n=1 Tax=Candida orthopsilosis (strain 90-125) TaxID=1136231 RepID=H8WXR0_CANO9|nr:Plb5 GPI-linked phospholipase B [Candida orthopsilosis Co 90-125]CCG20857.1 Plb5 GPI-linked phospholipase B [Candida orthopsilosis Co 90-125]